MASGKKKKPLIPLGDLLVLGGRYRFGRGETWNGNPLLYISIPSKPGITILEENLPAFHKMLGEVIEKFPNAKAKAEKTPTRTIEPQEKTVEEEVASADNRPCPGPTDESWLYIHKIEGGLKEAPELFEPHDFRPQSGIETACGVCTFDSARTGTYEKTAADLKLEEEGSPEKKSTSKRVRGRSPANP